MELKERIEKIWEDRALLSDRENQAAIRSVVEQLDKGSLRVAEPVEGGWQVNEWVKKAVILYFPIQQMETLEVGPFEFHDKIPLKKHYRELGVRVVQGYGLPARRPVLWADRAATPATHC
jgi:2,3,4,5-tetrahydropyridine-2-carboxylate N-succinyltransferase